VKEKRMKLKDIYRPDAVTIDLDYASFRPETAHGDDRLVGMVSMRDLLAVEAWM
jgi:hypothetical protein